MNGTGRPICKPRHDQRAVYNEHKRVHALKFQSVVAARGVNGIHTLGGVRDFCPAKLETALRKMRYIT